MTSDHSVSAGGNIVSSAIATGHHSSVHANFVSVGNENVIEALTAIRQVFAALPDVDPKALTRLEEASTEAQKPEPDRKEIKDLLIQAAGYARKATGFAQAVEGLAPHIQNLGAWFGETWRGLSDLLRP